MEVELTREHGFCTGVKKAVELAQETAREASRSGREVYTLGPLIHNRRVVRALEAIGIRRASSLADVPSGSALVLPSHGCRPDILAEAEARGIETRDATCPLVKRVQKAAKELLGEGYRVILVGQRAHTEVAGVVAWAGGEVAVVEGRAEAAALPRAEKTAVIAQTTQRPEKVEEVVEALREQGGEVRLVDTLCQATTSRQDDTRALAGRVDVLLVVGGRESANTQRLVEIGRELGRRVYHIEAAHEVDPSWFTRETKVGVTAGTSTPDWITEEVVARMKDFEPNAQVNGEQGDAAPPETSPDQAKREEAPAGANEAAMTTGAQPKAAGDFEKGTRVKGTVVKVGAEEILVDIGYKSEAVMPASEMSRKRVENPAELFKEGDIIEATVVKLDDEGHPILSRKRVEEEEAWSRLEQAFGSGETIEAPVTAQVKGGLVVDVGVRGFVPASQVGLRFIQDLAPYVGQTLKLKVIEVDRGERKAILSEKKVLEEERARAKAESLDTIAEGEVREGVVRRVTDYGAFVDIGGVDGLLHVSEMSWKRVTSPRDVVKEGDKITVKVLRVDKERGRISLGLKQTQPDPWIKTAADFPVGTVTKGKVVSVADFGAFVELADGVEGLVHVSQLSDKRVAKPSDVVRVGDELRVKVLKVNPQERRISLSAREGEEEMDRRELKKFMKTASESPAVTIGELVGDVLKGSDLGAKKGSDKQQE